MGLREDTKASRRPDTTGRRFSLGLFDLLTASDGTRYRVRRETQSGFELQRESDGGIEPFHYDEIRSALQNGAARLREYFTTGNEFARQYAAAASPLDLPIEELSLIRWRYEWAKEAFARMKALKCRGVGDDLIQKLAPEMAAKDVSRKPGPSGGTRKRNAGTALEIREPPTRQTLSKWIALLKKTNWSILALRDRRHANSGNRKPRYDDWEHQIIEEFVTEYMTEKRKHLTTVHTSLKTKFNIVQKSINKSSDNTVIYKKAPSKKYLKQQIEKRGAFAICASREGAAAALRQFRMVGGGLDDTIERPFQRIELDCWEVQLHVFPPENDAGKADGEAGERPIRLWAAAALDYATNSVVALKFGRTESTQLALAAVRMAMQNKDHIAAQVGAAMPWPMAGSIEQLVTDNGSAFGEDFKDAVGRLQLGTVKAVAGVPWLRAHIENLFSLCAKQILPEFTGRTFSGPKEKGDYDSQARATLTSDEFIRTFYRWVIDDYHVNPLSKLGGLSPIDAWNNMDRLVEIAPDANAMRVAFGINIQRNMDEYGVRFLNVPYNSDALQAFRRSVGSRKINIRIDLDDMGQISAECGGKWIEVRGHRKYREVSVDNHIKAEALVSRVSEATRERYAEVRDAARMSYKETARTAEHRLGFTQLALTKQELDALESRLSIGFAMGDNAPDEADIPEVSERFLAQASHLQPQSVTPPDDIASVPRSSADPQKSDLKGDTQVDRRVRRATWEGFND